MNLSRLLIPILIFPFLMRAAEVAPQPVDVAELVRQAVATNPERQAYDAALAAERETASAAGSNQCFLSRSAESVSGTPAVSLRTKVRSGLQR
jgi:hypothetical protein